MDRAQKKKEKKDAQKKVGSYLWAALPLGRVRVATPHGRSTHPMQLGEVEYSEWPYQARPGRPHPQFALTGNIRKGPVA